MSKKKILFAAVDIGWRIEHYSIFIKNNTTEKILVDSFVKHAVSKSQYRTNYTYHIQYDKLNAFLRWVFSFFFFLFATIKYDTFYFLSGETLLTRKLRRFEFAVYKLFNKRIIMHFVGSDIRSPEYVIWKEENIIQYINNDVNNDKTTNWQKKLIADSLKFSHETFVSTPDLLSIIPTAKYIPVFIDYEKFNKDLKSELLPKTNFFKTDKIKILHSPSHYKIKGSSIILEAIEKLKSENSDFEFIYTPDLNIDTGSNYPVTRYQLFKLYSEADIVIDQMTIGWYGLQSIEALLSNCHVFCYIEKELISSYFKDSPIIPTDAVELKNDLLNLLKNFKKPDLIKNQGWVKRNHTIENKGQIIIDAIFS